MADVKLFFISPTSEPWRWRVYGEHTESKRFGAWS
jgi:hypothetical protein